MSSSKNFNRVPTRVPKKEDVAKPPFYANFLNVNKIRFPSPAFFIASGKPMVTGFAGGFSIQILLSSGCHRV